MSTEQDKNTNTIPSPSEELIEEHQGFKKVYAKVLKELDVLSEGVYNPSDAEKTAALCLLAEARLIRLQAFAEYQARHLKRDIDFIKAEVYSEVREEHKGQRISEENVKQKVNQDKRVHKIYQEQNLKERESKELTNLLSLLRDAHYTFRSCAKKENN